MVTGSPVSTKLMPTCGPRTTLSVARAGALSSTVAAGVSLMTSGCMACVAPSSLNPQVGHTVSFGEISWEQTGQRSLMAHTSLLVGGVCGTRARAASGTVGGSVV